MKNLVFNSEQDLVKISFLERTGEISTLITDTNKNFVILDERVLDLHSSFIDELKAKNCSFFIIDMPEKQKNINTCLEIINMMQKLGFNRSDAVIGIGGGAVTDLAGFVASSYMLSLIHI